MQVAPLHSSVNSVGPAKLTVPSKKQGSSAMSAQWPEIKTAPKAEGYVERKANLDSLEHSKKHEVGDIS